MEKKIAIIVQKNFGKYMQAISVVLEEKGFLVLRESDYNKARQRLAIFKRNNSNVDLVIVENNHSGFYAKDFLKTLRFAFPKARSVMVSDGNDKTKFQPNMILKLNQLVDNAEQMIKEATETFNYSIDAQRAHLTKIQKMNREQSNKEGVKKLRDKKKQNCSVSNFGDIVKKCEDEGKGRRLIDKLIIEVFQASTRASKKIRWAKLKDYAKKIKIKITFKELKFAAIKHKSGWT